MFHLQYFDKSQLLSLFEYGSLKDAKSAIKENDVWNASTRYKITEVATGKIMEEEDFGANDGLYQMLGSENEIIDDFEVDDTEDND